MSKTVYWEVKAARIVSSVLLFCASSLLLLLALAALHPRIDVARMLIAASGSIIRGFIGVAGIGAFAAWLAARLGKGVMPRLVTASWALTVLTIAGGAANVMVWTTGMERRELEFVSEGARLKGTLMLPTAVDNPPVAVIVHGSPTLARDFYAVWGRHLVREGIAVFVYDKRGTGRSEGVVPRNNDTVEYLTQLGRDAANAFSAVQSQSNIDARRISLVGISQGGWTVPVAASLDQNIFRIALLSGAVATTREERAFSDVAGDGGRGPDDDIVIRAGDQAAATAPRGGFDPIPFLRATSAPGCWFFGGHDRSIPVSLSKQRLDTLSAEGRNVRYVMLEDTDHLLFAHTIVPLGFAPPLMMQLAEWLRGGMPRH